MGLRVVRAERHMKRITRADRWTFISLIVTAEKTRLISRTIAGFSISSSTTKLHHLSSSPKCQAIVDDPPTRSSKQTPQPQRPKTPLLKQDKLFKITSMGVGL
jgi:hypothetical protein